MKKQTKWALAAFVLLLALSTWLLLRQNKSTLKSKVADFAVKDTASITRIFLADKFGNRVQLERQAGGKWMLEGGSPARTETIRNLLETLSSLSVRMPVGRAAYNNIIKLLAAEGVKCEVYKGEELVKTLYVGSPTQDYEGTYMMLAGSDAPYVVEIPGFHGYLTTRFSAVADEWRSNVVFNTSFKELASVRVENLRKPEESYEVVVENQGPAKRVGRLYRLNPSRVPVSYTDTARVNAYLMSFGSVNYELPANRIRPSKRDSVLQLSVFRISVTNTKGKTQQATLYLKPVGAGEDLDRAGNHINYDVDRLYASKGDNRKDLYIVQYFVFDPLTAPLTFLTAKGGASVKK
jgi:hypothetical protein